MHRPPGNLKALTALMSICGGVLDNPILGVLMLFRTMIFLGPASVTMKCVPFARPLSGEVRQSKQILDLEYWIRVGILVVARPVFPSSMYRPDHCNMY